MSSKMCDLISEFKCAVCFDYMKPPIRMCVIGHSCCKSCFRRMLHCPECRGKKSGFRNLNLERIYYKLTFPCQNAEYGCKFVAKGIEVMTHEDKCIYSNLPCPFTSYGCTWSGLYNKMEDHLREAHDFRNDIPDFCDLRGLDEGANCWRQALKFDGHLFIVCIRKSDDNFWFGVYSVINTDATYNYDITFVNLEDNSAANYSGTCSTHKKYAFEELNRRNMQSAPGTLVEGLRQGNIINYDVEISRENSLNFSKHD